MVVRFVGERYECSSCNATSTDTQKAQADGWRCTSCGKHLQIYATDREGAKHVLERVSASSLEKGDLVLLSNEPFQGSKEVLDVSTKSKLIHVALKQYTVIKAVPAREFNRIIGAW